MKSIKAIHFHLKRVDAMKLNFYKSDPFDISRERKSISSMPSNHYHDAYEILYLVSGELYYFIEGRTYHVVSGVLLLININDIHRLVNINGNTYERVTLLFKSDFLSAFFTETEDFNPLSCFNSKSNVIKLSAFEQIFVENIFSKMIHEENEKQPGSSYYQKVLLMELLIYLQRKIPLDQSNQLVESNRPHKKISKILPYINENFSEQLSLEYMSRKFSISPSHLSRTFKETTGFTFVEYVNNIRVKEACSLLKNSDLSISGVAERVGFDNLTHFGRIFKALIGTSPLKFRKGKLD